MTWNDDRSAEWHNERIMESIISSSDVDFHGEVINQESIINRLPYLSAHGIYNYWHTNFPIGEILAWKLNDEGLPMIKVGIYDTISSNVPQYDEVWNEIKDFGTKGQSSIEGVSNLMRTQSGTPDTIEDMGLWAVAWVGDEAANKQAKVTFVNDMAKLAKSIASVGDKGVQIRINNNQVMKQYISEEIEKQLGGKEMTKLKKEEEVEDEEEIQDVPDDEVETIPEVVEAAEEDLPDEDEPVEEEEEIAKEDPAPGIAQDVAQLKETVEMLATSVTMLKPATPDALMDAAEAAEVVGEILESNEVEAAVEDDYSEESDELVMMRKQLESYKAQFGELEEIAPTKVEKESPVEKPQRRGQLSQTETIDQIPGFSTKGLIEANNNGTATEYMENVFGYRRPRDYSS